MKRPRCPRCNRAMVKETYWYCPGCGQVYNPFPAGLARPLEIAEERQRVRYWLDKIRGTPDPIERIQELRKLVKSVETGRDEIDVIRKVVKQGHLLLELKQVVALRALRNPGLYEKFHGRQPTKSRKISFEPPNPKQPLIKLGRMSQINYVPEFPSSRVGVEYYHKSGDTGYKTLKSNLILATDLKGKNLYLIRDGKSKYPIVTGRGIIG